MHGKYLTYVSIGLFILALLLIVVGLVSFFVGAQPFAEKIISYLWLCLACVAGLQIIRIFAGRFLSLWRSIDATSVRIYTKYSPVFVPVFSNRWIVFVLALCVVLLSGLTPFYTLGGDDTRLYYLYPKEFFEFTLRVGPDTALSSFSTFLPPSSIALFAGLLVLLKIIVGNLNLQAMLYTANIIAAMWGFNILVKYLIGNLTKYSIVLRVIFSFMYVFSIFVFYTLLNSQLIAIFLLSTFPISLYLYIRGIHENKKYFLVVTALIWTVFCYFSVSLPWFSAICIVVAPIILFHFRKDITRFLKANVFFAFVLILFNLHWLAAMSYTYALGGNNTTSSVASQSFRSQNEQGIRSVAENNTVFYPLLNTYHADIQKNYNWPYLPIFNRWYSRLLLLNSIWFGLILFAFRKQKNFPLHGLPFAILISFFISIYFFTAKIGNWGLPFFIWLSNTVPGFVMYRNMYDKFGFAMSFIFALSVLVSTEIIMRYIDNGRIKRGIIVFTVFILLLNAAPYLLGKFQALPIWTTQHSFTKLEEINSDYLELTEYVKEQSSDSRYLWLPLNFGNVSQIQDQKNPDYYYNGTSPFVLFSGKNDYSGIMSFERYGEDLADDIRARRYANVGKFLQRFNAKYVIVNHTVNDELKKSYLCGEGLCSMQDDEYKQAILGKKVRDFGKRYSLYEIHPAFSSEKFYLTDSLQSVTMKNVQYTKVSPREYSLHLKNIARGDSLVFLDPYTPKWKFYASDGKTIFSVGDQMSIFEYANGWVIDIDALEKLPKNLYTRNTDGTFSLDLTMRFELGNLYYVLVGISLLSIVVGVVFSTYKFVYEKIH